MSTTAQDLGLVYKKARYFVQILEITKYFCGVS